MGFNSSLQGTAHIRSLADAALSSEDGITIELPTESDCIRLRGQFNNFRSHERRFSKKLYKFDDPRFGASSYDSIETKITEASPYWHLTFRTVSSVLSHMKIIDVKTNKEIKPEDL